jgi:anti-sigma factor RsiW
MKSRRSIAMAVLLGTAVLTLLASSSFGRGGEPAPATDRKLHGQPQRLAHAARGTAAAVAAKGVKVRYLESDATQIGPGASDGYSFTCPKRTPRAVGAYGGSAQAANAGEIVIADSTPFKKGRSWSIGVKNLSAEPRQFYVGVVCVG